MILREDLMKYPESKLYMKTFRRKCLKDVLKALLLCVVIFCVCLFFDARETAGAMIIFGIICILTIIVNPLYNCKVYQITVQAKVPPSPKRNCFGIMTSTNKYLIVQETSVYNYSEMGATQLYWVCGNKIIDFFTQVKV